MFSIEREKVQELEQHVGSALEIVHHLVRTTAHDYVPLVRDLTLVVFKVDDMKRLIETEGQD